MSVTSFAVNQRMLHHVHQLYFINKNVLKVSVLKYELYFAVTFSMMVYGGFFWWKCFASLQFLLDWLTMLPTFMQNTFYWPCDFKILVSLSFYSLDLSWSVAYHTLWTPLRYVPKEYNVGVGVHVVTIALLMQLRILTVRYSSYAWMCVTISALIFKCLLLLNICRNCNYDPFWPFKFTRLLLCPWNAFQPSQRFMNCF